MKLEQIQLSITGRVQGVGFRQATMREAVRIGLGGWVRNLPDGSVETFAVGTPEEIERFLMWCHTGPKGSHVVKVNVLLRSQGVSDKPARFEIMR